FFFFFQAEDGIRDRTVTGVQTCALPILTVTLPARRVAFGLDSASAWFSKCRGRPAATSWLCGVTSPLTVQFRPGVLEARARHLKIGRASCRERVGMSVVGGCWSAESVGR